MSAALQIDEMGLYKPRQSNTNTKGTNATTKYDHRSDFCEPVLRTANAAAPQNNISGGAQV